MEELLAACSFNLKDDNKTALMAQCQSIIKLVKNMQSHGTKVNAEPVLKSVRKLLENKDAQVRGTGCRTIKYVLFDTQSIKDFIKLRIPFFIAKILENIIKEKGDKSNFERMQAVKVVRKIMYVDPTYLPPSLVYSLVSIVAENKDKFYRICVETLREVLVLNTRVAAECDIVSPLIDAIKDPICVDLVEAIILSVVHVLDDPNSRCYIKADLELEQFIQGFTNTELPPDNDRRLLWSICNNALVTIMRSWTGIILLTSDKDGLPALIDFLTQPVDTLSRKAVLKSIYDIFGMSFPSDHVLNEDRDLVDSLPTIYSKFYDHGEDKVLPVGSSSLALEPGSNLKDDDRSVKNGAFIGHNLIHNYISILLAAFLHNGIVESLGKLVVDSDVSISKLSIILLREILRLSSAFLPPQEVSLLLCLPSVMSVATSVSLNKSVDSRNKGVRSVSILNALSVNDTLLSQNKNSEFHRSTNEMMMEIDDDFKKAIDSFSSIQQKFFNNSKNDGDEWKSRAFKSCLDLFDEDPAIPDLIKATKVLAGKDWTKWDWGLIQNLLDNQLRHNAILAEIMKGKFMRRLGGFFRFDTSEKGATLAGLTWQASQLRYVHAMLSWFQIIIQSEEGIAFLQNDRRGIIVNEICDALKLECVNDTDIKSSLASSANRLFHPQKFNFFMVREYLQVIKLLSSSQAGVNILVFAKFFEIAHLLPSYSGREALCRLIMVNLNFGECAPARNVLTHWVEIASLELKTYIVAVLREVLRSNCSNYANWAIDLLMFMLGKDASLNECIINVLEEVSMISENLKGIIVRCSGSIKDHLLSSPFIFHRMLSLPSGFVVLDELNIVLPELQRWIKGDNNLSVKYVQSIDQSLMTGLHDAKMVQEMFYSPTGLPVEPTHIPIQMPQGVSGTSSNLEWLMRLPWTAELHLVDADNNATIAIVDTFIDTSLISNQWVMNKPQCAIRIRGNIVNEKREKSALVIPPNSSLKVILLFGNQAVDRDGKVTESFGADFVRTSGSARPGIPMSRSFPSLQLDCWSACSNDIIKQALDCRRYEFCIPGERVIWNFHKDEDGSEKPKLTSFAYTISFRGNQATFIPAPIHFVGELASSSVGCEMLQKEGDIPSIYATAMDPNADLLIRRSCLWTLGNIGSSLSGFALLESFPATENIIADLVKLCNSSPWLALRGTCSLVLGLLSRCSTARTKLLVYNWVVPMRDCPTVVTPQNSSAIFSLINEESSIKTIEKTMLENPTMNLSPALPTLRQEWKIVLKYISYLYNNIQQGEGHAKLQQLKKTKPKLFESVELLMYIHETVLSKFKVKNTIRRFIMTLFLDIQFSKNEALWDTVDGKVGAGSLSDASNIAEIEESELFDGSVGGEEGL